MESSRTLLAFGSFSRELHHRLWVAASEAGLGLVAHGDRRGAREALARGPAALIVSSTAQELDAFLLEARADLEHTELPIVMLAGDVDDTVFAKAFASGVDDVVRRDCGRCLVRRLRAVKVERAPGVAATRGRALLAEPDARRRIAIGRTLRGAGYAVTFAVTDDDAHTYASHSDFALIVASTELVPDQRAAIEMARTLGSRAAWIASTLPDEQKAVRRTLSGMSRVTVMDAHTSPDAVLFSSNELLNARGAEQRRTTRVLHGTVVAFRGAGRDEDDWGYTYNVSEGGMYVRTLSPPEEGTVWLELRAPGAERRVRLVGDVVWRRAYGGHAHATVPAGFGVRISDGARADLEAYQRGCRAAVDAIA